ncbi:MAG: hypothetical protein E7461_06460 [Ruminococcaceae bacterium]|nr:hypothetical protein [Oscillospiraceae bacterium]
MLLNLVGPERKLHRADKTIEKRLTFLTSDQISYSPIGIGMEKNDTGSYNPAIGYPHINKLGVKWVRIQSGWFRTEKEAGVYDFAWLDDIVDNILSQGCTPWMCLCYGNSVYDDTAVPGSRATDHPPIYTQDARLAWQRYVKACLAHFKGRVHYYEIWNEPDGTHCWGQGVNGAEYADLVRITAPLIRQADSDNKVIAGCMCNLVRMQTFCDEDYVGVNFDSDPGIGPFFQNWYQKDVAQMIDYVTFHSYAPRPEQKMNELYAALRKTLDMYNPNIGII